MNSGLVVHYRLKSPTGLMVAVMEDESDVWIQITPDCTPKQREAIENWLHDEGFLDFLGE